jgi:hypothetical protein
LYNEDGSDYEGDNDFALGLQTIFNSMYALGDDFTNVVLSTVEESGLSHFFEQEIDDESRVIPYPHTGLIKEKANEGIPVNTQVALNINGKNRKQATSTVAHELRHVFDYNEGKMKGEMGIPPSHESPKEIRAVNFENRARVRIGRRARTTYGGKRIDPKELLDPTKPYSE